MTVPALKEVPLAGLVMVATGAALGCVTVNVALLLVTEPALLVTTTLYVPACEGCTLVMVYVADVAPEMLVPFFRHWYVGAGLPVAVTLNEAVLPCEIVILCGCVVITGACVPL